MLTLTLVMYVIGTVLLVVGEAIALSKGTDREQPITYYLRRLRNRGPLLFLAFLVAWLWLGYHFLIDIDGSLPF